MLSWEYPPQMVGGLGQHVYELSRHLVNLGVIPHIITPSVPGAPPYQENLGVHIHRIGREYEPQSSFKGWIMSFNSRMIREGIAICRSLKDLRVIHAHDWLVAYGARTLGKMFNLPVVATIHATEWGRNGGLHNRTQMEINDIERNLTREAAQVICCSHYMQNEVSRLFGLEPEKIVVIPNGVTLEPPAPQPAAKNGKLVFFIGRLVPEKGIQVLVDAIPLVRERIPDVKLIIGGKGPCYQELCSQVEELGLSSCVSIPGYIDNETKNSLYQQAAVAVFPSLYEPFGIVALEAMAAGTPVVVSRVGGLDEIVRDGENGLKVTPDDPVALARAIINLLVNPELAGRLAGNAYRELEASYTWERIAAATLEQYKRATRAQEASKEVG